MDELHVGIEGPARVGKDTAGKYLNSRHGLEPIAFAGPIKAALVAMLDLTPAQLDGDEKETPIEGLGVSPRELFQRLGDWGRSIHPDFWIFAAQRVIGEIRRAYALGFSEFPPGFVYTDVRYDNEAEWIRERGGTVVHLRRQAAPKVRAHSSEDGIRPHHTDLTVHNDGAIEELHQQLDVVMRLVAGGE